MQHIDTAPTEDSTNPVTSGGVAEALEGVQDKLSYSTQEVNRILGSVQHIDTAPTDDSTNPVTSGGVAEALEEIQEKLTTASTETCGSIIGELV